MGLFESIFKKEKTEKEMQGYWKSLSAYTPVYTSFEGGVYEMALTRAAINAFALHVSKLKPEVRGINKDGFEQKLQHRPNPFHDTSKFLARLATIYKAQNNAFIAPLYVDDPDEVTGYFPLLPQNCKIVEVGGVPYIKYQFAGAQVGAIELDRAGILTQMQYYDDIFGENNAALLPTMKVMDIQNQGIIEGVKNSATIRFMAKLASTFKEKTVEEERKRFREANLGPENNNGIFYYDNKYEKIEPIESKAVNVNAAQMKEIKDSVYTYFGTNDEILQNKYTNSAVWTAYYEGQIEPFAIQLSLVMTNMTYSDSEIAAGAGILWTANRLQYATNEEKLHIVTQLFDRGFINRDMGLEIFNMAPLPDGQGKQYYIRRDYAAVNELSKDEEGNVNAIQTG